MAFYIGFDIGGTKCAVSLGKWENQKNKRASKKRVNRRYFKRNREKTRKVVIKKVLVETSTFLLFFFYSFPKRRQNKDRVKKIVAQHT